jgi:thioesterase domain-containing protein/acyl carrier protein
VVTAHESAQGSTKLVAYVQATTGEVPPTAAELRAFLAEVLPVHMIPSAFVVLDSLPLNANGKVDRAALPAPEGHEVGARGTTPPRDEIEQRMVEIWREVLEVEEPIGIEDDFFDLGGHSLIAVRLFAEIENMFGKRLPLALLFQGATVEDLAAAVRDERDLDWPTLVPLRAEGTKPPLFLFHGINGAIVFYRGLARHLSPDQPVYAVQPQALDGRTRPHTNLQSMAAEYVAELRRFYPGGPYLVGGHCFSGVLAYEVARQLTEGGEPAPFIAVIDGAPVGVEQLTRIELERMKFRNFAEQDLAGKAAWIARRWRGLLLKIRKRGFWLFHDALVAARVPLPSRFLDVRAATVRARKAYVTPTSGCRVTLFRAEVEMGNSFERISMWNRLAHGGVDIRPVPGGARHDNIMDEPYVRALAEEMTAALAAVYAADAEQKQEVA